MYIILGHNKYFIQSWSSNVGEIDNYRSSSAGKRAKDVPLRHSYPPASTSRTW